MRDKDTQCDLTKKNTVHCSLFTVYFNTEQIEKLVYSFLNDCPYNTTFLLAVSGGADSMALLAALMGKDYKIRVLHVEHALRPAQESQGDAEFVRSFCEKNGVDCRIVHIPPGKIESFARRKGTGIEAAARFFRRKALLREAARLEKNELKAGQAELMRGESKSRTDSVSRTSSVKRTLILTAHTKDDALELALMRIMRGAGPAGLAAMPVKKGRFLRPLLSVTRAEIAAYLKEKNIPWREDSSNTDEKFLRNKIRRRLIPLLNEAFPSWKKGLAGMAATQSFAAEFISSEAENRIHWGQGTGYRGQETDEANFFAQPQIVREEAVYQAINNLRRKQAQIEQQASARSIKRSVIRRFCEGKVNAADFGPARIARKNGKITLSIKREDYFEKGVSLLI